MPPIWSGRHETSLRLIAGRVCCFLPSPDGISRPWQSSSSGRALENQLASSASRMLGGWIIRTSALYQAITNRPDPRVACERYPVLSVRSEALALPGPWRSGWREPLFEITRGLILAGETRAQHANCCPGLLFADAPHALYPVAVGSQCVT